MHLFEKFKVESLWKVIIVVNNQSKIPFLENKSRLRSHHTIMRLGPIQI